MKANQVFFVVVCVILFCLAIWSVGIALVVWLLRVFGVNI